MGSFDVAWTSALRQNPPRRSDTLRIDPWGGETLFDVGQGLEDLSLVEFMRDCCRQAWHGEAEVLRHFSLDMLAEDAYDVPRTGIAA